MGAYGGISVSTYPLWKGYVNDTSKQLDFADMASGFYATSFHNDSPDLIITTQALYRTYEAIGSGQRRFDSKDTKFDAGFESLEYRGADVIWDRDCPDGDVFFVNTDHYKLYNLGGKGFEMIGPTHSINQPLLDVYAIAWHGTFACDERRTMGVLKSRTAG